MNLLTILSDLEENTELHLARLLILSYAFAGKDSKGTIDGLTKLAKLDFLLRYPTYLRKALITKNASTKNVLIKPYEKYSVESSMIRFRYGPWDFRYRKFLNILVGKGLLTIEKKGNTFVIGITATGEQIAKDLLKHEEYADTIKRAKTLKTHFDIKGTSLMKFIYKTFPEIGYLSFGETIGS